VVDAVTNRNSSANRAWRGSFQRDIAHAASRKTSATPDANSR
jgi:hypothetical protein